MYAKFSFCNNGIQRQQHTSTHSCIATDLTEFPGYKQPSLSEYNRENRHKVDLAVIIKLMSFIGNNNGPCLH